MRPLPAGLREWQPEDIRKEIRARAGAEKRRREMTVYYYRIGYPISYPLPLVKSPEMNALPVGIQGITYPWYTWLGWALEERWRRLHAAWRHFGDVEAGALLQGELAALEGWDQYCEVKGHVSLSTAHISACLSRALPLKDGWDEEKYGRARAAAEKIIEREAWPWFQREWPEGETLAAEDLHNIRVIGLTRCAQLARVIASPRAEAMETRTREALRAWYRLRPAGSRYTEGSAYDGFLLDSLTEWLSGLPDREALLNEGRESLPRLAGQWIRLALPGRVDVQAPLGDVEPEMPFWATVLQRFGMWGVSPGAGWLARRLPVQPLPAAFLTDAIENINLFKDGVRPPESGPSELPHALSLRTGWDGPDILAAVGLTRSEPGHLHNDAGQVVLGWRGRFWITDPGYQQYRPGIERDFSMGKEAHNIPVIAGKAQTRRAPKLLSLGKEPDGTQRAVIDLTECYEGLPRGAYVEREVRLLPAGGVRASDRAVIVRDRLTGVGGGTEVQTSWLAGTHLAWAFKDGWARLSDGERALWIGVFPGGHAAAGLDRHEGSRGPLTLKHSAVLPDGRGDRFWAFVCDEAGGWEPPAGRFEAVIGDWDKR